MGYRRAVTAAVAALIWLGAGAPCKAQMRCGNDLVHEGDYKAQVLLKCGEPLLAEHIYECRPYGFGCGVVEQWTYDLGTYRMLRVITFRDGRVDRIELAQRP
jgi:hypothetical protein